MYIEYELRLVGEKISTHDDLDGAKAASGLSSDVTWISLGESFHATKVPADQRFCVRLIRCPETEEELRQLTDFPVRGQWPLGGPLCQ